MLGDLLVSMKRRWYVVIVVIGVFAFLGWSLLRDGGTYFARTVVWFTADEAPTILPENGSGDGEVISFAGAIATELNRGRTPANYASAAAPYYGAGVRQGILVALRDVGGQWSSWYSAAVIELRIVGRTEQWVATRRDDLLARIYAITEERTSGAARDAGREVTVSVEPLTRSISYVSPSRVQVLMALAALGLAALFTGALAASTIDRAIGRARQRPRGAASRTDESETVPAHAEAAKREEVLA